MVIVQASPTAAYIAFSDQDDLWLPNRISRAVATLNSHPQSIPTLYATSARVVDQNLAMLGSLIVPQHILAFQNALVECPLLGCTFLINQALRQIFLKKIPQHSYGHDWWLYLLASAFGEIIYDPEPGLLYRQHSNNLFGAASNTSTTYKDQHQAFAAKLHQLQKRMHRYLNEGRQRRVTEQAREFQHIYQSLLTPKYQQILENFLTCRENMRNRLLYALFSDVYRQSISENMILKLLIAFDRL